MRALASLLREAPAVCAGTASPPTFLGAVDSKRVVFLTAAAEPLRSEQYFCLQFALQPRLVVRAPLISPQAPLGFAPDSDAVVFAATSEELAAVEARLALEIAGGRPELRRAESGWSWFEAPSP